MMSACFGIGKFHSHSDSDGYGVKPQVAVDSYDLLHWAYLVARLEDQAVRLSQGTAE